MKRVTAWATGHPVDLAVFRIVICAVVLLTTDVWSAARWAPVAVKPPDGWVFVSHLFPASPLAAQLATATLAIAVVLTLVGLFTQFSSIVAACSALWLLGIPQQSGQVMHTRHLAWFLAIVAVSPAGDALSIDRWLKSRRGVAAPGPSLAHGVPLRVAWLSVGLIFFFPGMWKALSGRAWLDSLPLLVEWKWFQLGGEPLLSLPPGVLWWGGLAAIAFELGFIITIFSARTRVIGAVLAIAFHQAIRLVMGIVFSSLWVCYAMFLPWADWAAAPEEGAPTPRSRAIAPLILGVLLLGGQLVTGFLGREDTWPVVSYPSFRFSAPEVIEWLEVEEIDASGPHLTLGKLEGGGEQRRWGVMTELLHRPNSERLRAFYGDWRGTIPPNVTELRFYRLRKRLGDPSAPERILLAASPAQVLPSP